jgi:hypothetical protein
MRCLDVRGSLRASRSATVGWASKGAALACRSPRSESNPTGTVIRRLAFLGRPGRRLAAVDLDDDVVPACCFRQARHRGLLRAPTMACHRRFLMELGSEHLGFGRRCSLGQSAPNPRGSVVTSAVGLRGVDLFGDLRRQTRTAPYRRSDPCGRTSPLACRGCDEPGADSGPKPHVGADPKGSAASGNGRWSRETGGCGDTLQWRLRTRKARTRDLRSVRPEDESENLKVEHRKTGATAKRESSTHTALRIVFQSSESG